MDGSILVVDGDADAREMLRLALAADGYPVATAASGRAALHCLRSIDTVCVILDLDLADDMDGGQFVAAQRRDRGLAWIPIVVVSERGDAADVAQSLRARACLRKPLDLDELRRVVADIVGSGTARDRR